MISDFKSAKAFFDSLLQVEVLIIESEKHENTDGTLSPEDEKERNLKYQTFLKVSLLLLTTKFESFIENIVTEYIEKINNLNLKAKDIPVSLKYSHSLFTINQSFKFSGKEDNKISPISDNTALKFFETTSNLWTSKQTIFNQLKVSNKFNYGKHGSDELLKLFKNIGIDDIFATILIQRDLPTVSGVVKDTIDFKEVFDGITKFRNLITHHDATPPLTLPMLKDNYLFSLKEFTINLTTYLSNEITTLMNK